MRVKHLKQVLLASFAAALIGSPAQAEPLEPATAAEAAKLINNIRNKLDSCGEEGMLSNQGTQRVALAVAKPRPMLAWSPKLATVAQQHAKAMAEQNFFDHIDPQGRSVGNVPLKAATAGAWLERILLRVTIR